MAPIRATTTVSGCARQQRAPTDDQRYAQDGTLSAAHLSAAAGSTSSSSLITAAAIISSSRSPITDRAIAIRIMTIRRRPITGAAMDIDSRHKFIACRESAPQSRRDWLARFAHAHPHHPEKSHGHSRRHPRARRARQPVQDQHGADRAAAVALVPGQSAGGAQAAGARAARGGGSMPRVPRQQMPEPDDEPVQIPTRKSGSGSDFDELRDSVRRVPRGNGGEMEAGRWPGRRRAR